MPTLSDIEEDRNKAYRIHELEAENRSLKRELFAKNKIISRYRDYCDLLPFEIDYAPFRYKWRGNEFVVVSEPVPATDVEYYLNKFRELYV